MTKSEFSVRELYLKLASSRDAGKPISLSTSDIVRALNAFLAGEITKEEIAEWAEFYDANEDVEFEDNEAIPDVIFNMSSPEINGWLDDVRAHELLLLLSSPRGSRQK